MRILLIADASSLWTAKYLEKVLLPLGYQITVLTPSAVAQPFVQAYPAGRVTVIRQRGPHSLVARIPLLRGLSARWRTASRVRREGEFDFVHVQMAVLHRVRLAIWIATGPVIVSFWGSDLLRQPALQLRMLRRLLDKADRVTVNSQGMLREFRRRFPGFDPSPQVIPFGVNGIEAIDRVKEAESREEACVRLGFPVDSLIVTAGYNARPEQQHLMMLRAIAALAPKLKQMLHIVLPMTYGAGAEAIAEVREVLTSIGCSSTVLTKFMDEEDQARLAVATDVFINAQTTDALSASLQEFIYGGAEVLNGAWLDYSELLEAGVVMHTFSDLEDLTVLLGSVVEGFVRDRGMDGANRVAMRNRSWAGVARIWGALYQPKR